jgi:hypothetical protein
MFDIQTTVDVSREDIKKNLTKLIGMRMAGMDGLPASIKFFFFFFFKQN